MAVATAEARIYDKTLQYLSDKGGSIFVSDLPKELTEPRVLNAAWSEGVVEFGRANYSETGIPLHANDSRANTKIFLLDAGVSWTGTRSTRHGSLATMLEEDKSLPECFSQVKVVDPNDKDRTIVTRKKVEGNPLRLQIRITDKGWGRLAS
jgi:hypothetical protein